MIEKLAEKIVRLMLLRYAEFLKENKIPASIDGRELEDEKLISSLCVVMAACLKNNPENNKVFRLILTTLGTLELTRWHSEAVKNGVDNDVTGASYIGTRAIIQITSDIFREIYLTNETSH